MHTTWVHIVKIDKERGYVRQSKAVEYFISISLCPEGAENIPLGSQVSDLCF